MFLKRVVVLFFLFCFCMMISLQAVEPDVPEYKDPFLAGFLSWVMPGCGQIYSHAYTKGSLFLFGNLVDKTALVSLVLYLNNNYNAGSTSSVRWNELKQGDQALIITYVVLNISYKLFNSIDAVFTAQNYNEYTRKLSVHWNADIVPGSEPSGSFSYSMRF